MERDRPADPRPPTSPAVPERVSMRPASAVEARGALVEAVAAGRSVLIRGGGTKLDWGGAVDADVELDTRGLDRLVAHNAADMTAVVGAGMPFARLQEQLAEAGQWLALDPPLLDPSPGPPDPRGERTRDGGRRVRSGPAGSPADRGATVGGIVAAGDAGPRRMRYGTVRDLVIGSTFVLADGTVAHSGGLVIKNVAGYDLTRLLCGSLGTLGLVTELAVRLHPLPAASRTLRITADARDAARLAAELATSSCEPSAVEWVGDPGGIGTLLVRVEGAREGVGSRASTVEGLARGHALDAERLDGDAAEAAWREHAETVTGDEGETVARAGFLADRLPEVASALARAAAEAGTGATVTAGACLGLATCRISGRDAAAHAATLTRWRQAVEQLGGTVTLRRRLAGVGELADPWGAPPSAVALMRAVKRQLDPGDRLAPGRFGSWLSGRRTRSAGREEKR
jgi:glycolate oxidase FAD binding subunit